LKTLHLKNSSFIFATHFHEIVDYEEIHELDKMILQHMEVHYNKQTNALEYDRKLKDGSGPKSYGLEVCKSLYLEDEFIDLAYHYRNKYYPENQATLVRNTTPYNAKKIKGICEICNKNIGTEIHHLRHQQEATKEGFIDNFHKNHKANLVSICEECHLNMHDDNNKNVVKRKKKTTKGYILANN
jgi:DNA mismatch repair protein MutS